MTLHSRLLSVYYSFMCTKVHASACRCVQVREIACMHLCAVPRSFLAAQDKDMLASI